MPQPVDLEKVRAPLGYIAVALGFAALFGWAIGGIISSTAGAPGSIPLAITFTTGAVGAVLAVAAYVRHLHRTDAQRRAALEERLRESEEHLRQAQKMEAIGQLAGGIAHDFNNLITVIGCSVGLLADATEPEDARQDDLGQIKEAVDRAAALTRQLLAFSRRQVLQPRPLDLNGVVRNMEKMIRRVIGSHIAVHTTLDAKLGQILADPGQLEQVVMNLAVNARDAMPASGALMFATANRSVRMPEPHRYGVIEPGEYVTLTVRDTGQGMPAMVLEHLFEPFFTTKEQGKGTGLGLATVHGIVSQLGGYVTVESTLGVGTVFTLLFPRIGAGGEQRHHTPPGGIRVVQPLGDHPRTVLVVDDEDAIRDISDRVLQQAGFRVLTAKHGEEAIDVLNHEREHGTPVSLVLTDVVMPVMGGRELTDIVFQDYPESHVLCISGYARDELFRQYLIDDTVRLVHKPFEASELIAAVRNALGESVAS